MTKVVFGHIIKIRRMVRYLDLGKNLIKPGKKYYHNALKEFNEAPKSYFDINTGQIIRYEYRYVSKQKEVFTIDDLVEYWCRITKQERSPKIEGAMVWLSNKYDVDLILFMIDAMKDFCDANSLNYPDTPLEIQDYIQDAKENIVRKISEAEFDNEQRKVC